MITKNSTGNSRISTGIFKKAKWAVLVPACFGLLLTASAAELLPPTPCFQGVCAEPIDASEGPIDTSPGPIDTSPGTPGIGTNWNPGIYLNYKAAQLLGFEDPDQHTTSRIEPFLMRSHACSNADVQGISVRFHWNDMEKGTAGNYAPGERLMDELLRVLRKMRTDCPGTKAKRMQFIHDAFAFNKFARRRECIADPYLGQELYWETNRGSPRCAAPVWRNGSAIQTAYRNMVLHFSRRYKDEPLIEFMSAKGEGSLGLSTKIDPTFDYTLFLSEMLYLGQQHLDIAPRIAWVIGTNNYRAGESPNELVSLIKPAIENKQGYGLRWPDTFSGMDDNFWGALPVTQHHVYYPQFRGNVMMVGDWQIPGDRFKSFQDAWEVCCNPAGYTDPRANNNDFSPPTSNHSYGTTHVQVVTTYPAPYQPQTALAVLKANGNKVSTTACPAWWPDGCITGAY